MFSFFKKKNNKPQYKEITISDIISSPYQPRRYYDSVKLDGLCRSVKRYGVLQPILVRPVGKKYEVISGERRIRAASVAGFRKIPAIVTEMADSDVASCSMSENLHRENLTFLDVSAGLEKIAANEGYNLPSLAYALSLSEAEVEEKLAYNKFTFSVKRAISCNKITEAHAKELLRLCSEEKRLRLIGKIAEHKYDVTQTSEIVDKILLGETPTIRSNKKYNSGDFALFRNTIKRTVEIMRKSGISLTSTEKDLGDSYEYTVKVAKAK